MARRQTVTAGSRRSRGCLVAAKTPMSGYQGWVERCFLRCVVVVGAVAWLSLVLAELGRLRVGLLLCCSPSAR